MKRFRHLFILFLLFPLSLLAQQPVTVTGRITDAADGSGIPGVSVKVKGTAIGAQTDADGRYSITAPGNDATLQISFVGYVAQEFKVGDKTTHNIILTADTKSLDEVVVVGYGTQKRETLTGSVATVKGKDLVVTKNESVLNMMTGRIPGVRIVQRTAEPGGYDNNLNIRGFKGNPLIVVDGVIGGDLARMDPNEIENISVLKDAAASIYGLRAAGGVILVTTKKGDKNGKVDLNYSVNQGYQQFRGMPEGVDAVDFMLLTNEKTKRPFATNFFGNDNPTYAYADIQPFLDGTRKSADWIGTAFKKWAPQIQHNLNLTGGAEKISYFFNLGYMKQDGVFKTNSLNYDRYNLRSNITANITKGLKAQVLMSGFMDQKNQPFWDQWTIFKYTWNQVPTKPIYANDNPEYPAVIDDNANPATMIDADKVGDRIYKKKNFNGQLNLEYQIPGVKGLTAKALYNMIYNVDDNTDRRRQFNLYTYNAENGAYIPSPVQSPSTIRRSYYTSTNTLSQLSLNYVNTFFNDHNVSATLVYEQQHQTGDNFYAQKDVELPIDYLFGGLDNTNMLGGMSTGGLYEFAFRSIIGRLNYDYKGKYLAEFSFRRDGSNRYMPGKDQWGFFPAVSVGWVITKESFFQKLVSDRVLTNLKLRASYGETADEDGRGFNYLSGFNYPIQSYIFGSSPVNGSTIRNGAPNLTWAVNTKKNIAVDFTLWNGKLDGTIEAFRSDRKGLATKSDVTLPGTVGAELPEININSDRVQGLDLILTYRGKTGDIGYNITGNVGTTRAKTLYNLRGPAGNEWDNWRNNPNNRYQNIWWGLQYAGQFTNYQQIQNHPVNMGGGNNNVVPGDYYYVDWNEDGQIDGKDQQPIATTDIPLVNYGMNINLTYKNFDLSVLLQGATGVYVQYGEQYGTPLMYNRSALTRFLDSWHTVNPDDNVFDPNTQWVPGYYPAMGSDYGENTTRSVQNAKYLRIKTLELGYTVAPQLLKRVGVKRLRVYVNSYNLATFTGLKNYDPEHPGTKPGVGFEDALGGYKYPMNRTFNMGANISF